MSLESDLEKAIKRSRGGHKKKKRRKKGHRRHARKTRTVVKIVYRTRHVRAAAPARPRRRKAKAKAKKGGKLSKKAFLERMAAGRRKAARARKRG